MKAQKTAKRLVIQAVIPLAAISCIYASRPCNLSLNITFSMGHAVLPYTPIAALNVSHAFTARRFDLSAVLYILVIS